MHSGNRDIEKVDDFSREVGETLREYRMPVDADVWNSLVESLSAPRKKIPVYWIWSVAGVAALLLGFFFFLNPLSDERAVEMVQENPENMGKQPDIPVSEPVFTQKEESSARTLVAQEAPLQKSEMKKADVSFRASSDIWKAADSESLLSEAVSEDISTQAAFLEPDMPEVSSAEATPAEQDVNPAALYLAADSLSLPVQTQDSQKQHSFLLALGSGNSLPDITFGGYDGNESFYYDNPVSGGGFPNDSETSQGEKYNLLTPGDYTEIVHHLPVTISVTTDFPVGANVSLETGLSYTYLFSRFRRNDQLTYRGTLQQHYIGIPVNLRYQVWQNDSWSLYLLGGATVEKGIRSIYKQEIEQQGDVVHHTEVYNRIAGLQFSAQGGAGFSYRLQNNLHLFGEPRLLYYFKNNQPLSARTENPFIFGLNVGLRIQFK